MAIKKICIVGLGYVGLPLACLAARKGCEVYGIDSDKDKLEKIAKGINPMTKEPLKEKINITEQNKAVSMSNIIIVCVPTPVDKDHMPDFRPLTSAAETISKNLRKGHLIVIESTVNPGVCEEIVKPLLEKSGLKAEKDFYIVHCPERINPGDEKWNVENIPRVIGGLSNEGTEKAFKFYSSIINAKITKMSSAKAAEAVKIMENTFRDVNIAFVNELAKSFDNLGIDIIEVIKGASTKPFAFLPHYPGCGVGGHCIPTDPYYLIEKAKSSGFDHKFLKLAREINNSMPDYTIELLKKELEKIHKNIKNVRVGVLGIAYKGNIADIRESPALKIVNQLKNLKADVSVYDPYVLEKSNAKSLHEILEKCDCLILATNHPEFKEIEDINIKNIKIIIDGRNFLNKEKIVSKGIAYRGIGR